MYISPFIAGIALVLLIEFAVLIVYGAYRNYKKK